MKALIIRFFNILSDYLLAVLVVDVVIWLLAVAFCFIVFVYTLT